MKTKLLFLFLCASISLSGLAQSISYVDMPTEAKIGKEMVVKYKYTALVAGQIKFSITKNGGTNPWDFISTVVFTSAAAQVGTDLEGTFKFNIPTSTTPTSKLTGNQNYRIKIELFNSSNTWLKGDYSVVDYNFTPGQYISITSIPQSTAAGTNITVDYSYTLDAPGIIKFSVTKNGGATPSTFISQVAFQSLNPAAAGVDATGTFNVLIPAATTPTSSLTGNENYRVKVETYTAADVWIAGDYSAVNYNFTPSLGINDNKLLDAITIYPNPVEATLNINNLNDLTNTSYSVYNVLGTKVLQTTGLNNSINVSNLSSGTYILSVKADEGVKNFKFQKK